MLWFCPKIADIGGPKNDSRKIKWMDNESRRSRFSRVEPTTIHGNSNNDSQRMVSLKHETQRIKKSQ